MYETNPANTFEINGFCLLCDMKKENLKTKNVMPQNKHLYATVNKKMHCLTKIISGVV